ncbi:MAG: UDP-N-acetylmuramoyl-tripeptide--D-alanyl-D-alanine ligase [Bacteroidales bacterium]|nr:UDP-N-acetylmuramoyl-tripeptide--D-alanyl-D-alanine ligase [Bacteroidales bacterium]
MDIAFIYEKYLACGGRVTTDSRAVRGGELFVALKGENFDGNRFVPQALEAGAAWAVASRDAGLGGDPRVIEVEDTYQALKALANHHRRQFSIPVIGLTGTNGKTTTKELIRAALSAGFRVCATEGNLNNDIGVPLSLLKIRPETEIAVIEMGANHPDDIEKLVSIVEPDAGLITNVGRAHLLGFGSFEGVKRAKGQLYDYLAAHGGTVFLNEDNPDLREMAAARAGLSIVPYGVGYDGVKLLPADAENPFLALEYEGLKLQTSLVGAYNADNVLAALCIARHYGVPVPDAVAAIAAYVPSNNRSQRVRTERNTLIVDAYNANPSSMAAALRNFAQLQAPGKIALLGDMLELGEESRAEHARIVDMLVAEGLDARLVGAEFAAVADGRFPTFASSEALAEELKARPVSGATLLVKGSRGIAMEKVIPVL